MTEESKFKILKMKRTEEKNVETEKKEKNDEEEGEERRKIV